MKALCPEPPLVAFRRPKNLRDSLVRAVVKSPNHQTTPSACGPCSARGPKRGRKCDLCKIVPTQSTITSSSNSRIYPLRLKKPADCDSRGVIYCITCKVCSSVNQYVGQTSNFRSRMNSHKSNIRLGRMDEADCSHLYTHFAKPGHSIDSLTVTILQYCPDLPKRLEAEARWMLTLDTIWPHGLNTKNELS